MNSDNHQQNETETKPEHEHKHNSINYTPNTSQPQPQKLQNKNIPPLSIQLPPSIQEVNTYDEPTTPTSSDHKIPVPATCPRAPRKPRFVRVGNKRKTPNVSRISVDLMVVFNAMFVPSEVVGVLAGDVNAGERVKKVKKTDVTIG